MHRRNASEIHEEEGGGNPLYLIREEIAIMKKLNHHNLVGLLEVLDDPTEDSLYMVMEMCKKGVVMKVEVGDRADPYTPEECRCWFRDLILGIEYLHAQGIVHRDIKPDNLLLDDDDVLKVVDFGVSEMFNKEADMTLTKSAGSPAFLPPELCVTRHEPTSGKAVDVWSMGVTLFCLYHGRVPFEQHTVIDLYEAIKTNEPVVEPKDGDDDFPDLMSRLLEKDPEKRIQMHELRVRDTNASTSHADFAGTSVGDAPRDRSAPVDRGKHCGLGGGADGGGDESRYYGQSEQSARRGMSLAFSSKSVLTFLR